MKKIIAVGHALCDVLCHIDDDFLTKHGLTKNAMMLTDSASIDGYLKNLKINDIVAGGSAANSIAGIAMLGGNTAFIGTIGNDDFGQRFTSSLAQIDVDFDDENACITNATSGRCLILVSDDGARTMLTDLADSHHINKAMIDNADFSDSAIVYCEGYLFDDAHNKQIFHDIAQKAKQKNCKTAITLSDGFCVDRHRDDFMDFIKSKSDILFANEQEITSLWQCDDLQDALAKTADICPLSFITHGENGAYIVADGSIRHSHAIAVDNLCDTTGAGDQFAAGVLYGLLQDSDNQQAHHQYAMLGAAMASATICDYGARPNINRDDMLQYLK